MPEDGYRVRVPGKLMIAGEYAVLEPDQQAVVVAVDRYITAEMKPSDQSILSLPQLGLGPITWTTDQHGVHFNVSDPKLRFIQNAIALFHQFLQETSAALRPFHLTITSELDDPSGRKYGLGSSAAIVVAVITALCQFHRSRQIRPSLEVIFKLSAITHLKTQGSGSGADIAASTYGGWLCYAAFQSRWVLDKLQQNTPISELLEIHWPKLKIHPISPPPLLELCVGWTGKPAATAPMIARIQKLRTHHPDVYTRFLENSATAVSNLIKSFETDDCGGAIASLSQNRQALRQLSDRAGITIETPQLETLARLAEKYGSGKSSGAGGGDCGIAFVKGTSQLEKLYQAWEKANIVPLPLGVSQKGAKT